MLDARARLAVAPRDQDVTDGRVLLEVPEAVAVHPQDLLPLRLVHPGRSHIMRGALDDELGRPARRDLVVEPDALPHHTGLDPEVGIDLGNDPHAPPRAIGRRSLFPVCGDLRRRARLTARTKGTLVGRGRNVALGPNENPLAASRIFSQRVHLQPR